MIYQWEGTWCRSVDKGKIVIYSILFHSVSSYFLTVQHWIESLKNTFLMQQTLLLLNDLTSRTEPFKGETNNPLKSFVKL